MFGQPVFVLVFFVVKTRLAARFAGEKWKGGPAENRCKERPVLAATLIAAAPQSRWPKSEEKRRKTANGERRRPPKRGRLSARVCACVSQNQLQW